MTPLQQAAQAVLDRWNSPKWDWHKQGPTADLMHALQAAIAQPAQPATVPCQNDSMAEHACKNRNQCWEPCGELGHSAEYARVSTVSHDAPRPVAGDAIAGQRIRKLAYAAEKKEGV